MNTQPTIQQNITLNLQYIKTIDPIQIQTQEPTATEE